MPRVRSSLMSLTVQAYIFSLWAILKLQTIIKFSKCIRFYDIWWDKIIPKIFGIGDWFFMVWFYSREQRWTRRCSIPRGNLCELTSPGMEESQQLGEGWGSNRGHGWIPFWDSLLRGGAYIWTDNFWFPRTKILLSHFSSCPPHEIQPSGHSTLESSNLPTIFYDDVCNQLVLVPLPRLEPTGSSARGVIFCRSIYVYDWHGIQRLRSMQKAVSKALVQRERERRGKSISIVATTLIV